MLNEQEDDRSENFREGGTDEPTETKDKCACTSNECDDLRFLYHN